MQKKHEKKVGDASVQKMEGDTRSGSSSSMHVLFRTRADHVVRRSQCARCVEPWTTVHAAPAFFLHRQGRPPRSPALISPAP